MYLLCPCGQDDYTIFAARALLREECEMMNLSEVKEMLASVNTQQGMLAACLLLVLLMLAALLLLLRRIPGFLHSLAGLRH